MKEATLVRRIRFRARHHYVHPGWSGEENRRVFGDQMNVHEHDWSVEVHVSGPIATDTGFAVDLAVVDAALGTAMGGWDGGDLNVLIPEVAAGSMRPTTENIARWLHDRLSSMIPPPARVLRVAVFESEDLGALYPS